MSVFAQAKGRARAPAGAPKVGIFGLFGSGSLGNEGSLEAMLAYLHAEHPDVVLDFMCSGPTAITARYGVPATRLRWTATDTHGKGGMPARAAKLVKVPVGVVMDLLRTASWVRRHDVVIVPGTGVLEVTIALRAWHTPYSIFLVSVAGRVFGTKVALVNVGASDINQYLARRLISTAARLAYYRSFRDAYSRDALMRMGVDTSTDPVYPDIAFYTPVPSDVPATAGVVGVGVMDYHGGNDDRKHTDELRASYAEKMKSFVLWLVDNGHPVRMFTSDVHDEPIMHDVIAHVRACRPDLGPSQLIAEPASSVTELERQIASVETVVASRYHNVLYAVKLNKPVLAAGYAAKFGPLMEDMGLSDFWQSAKSLDVSRLTEQFTELKKNAAGLRPAMAERTAANARLLAEQFTTLSAVLFGTVKPGRAKAGSSS